MDHFNVSYMNNIRIFKMADDFTRIADRNIDRTPAEFLRFY